MTTRAGVVGDPISQSLSPAIFRAAFEARGLDWAYEPYRVAEGHLEEFLRGDGADLVGFSVTMPHKAAIRAFLDDGDPVASTLEAVNCVVRREDGRIEGHNTDGTGFLQALRHDADVEVADQRCVVVGAGGAGRAVALALYSEGAREVVVVNRSAANAQAAVAPLLRRGRVGRVADITAADIVVNTTSVGMGDGMLPFDPAFLAAGQVVVDIVYSPLETPLLRAARARGLRTVDGLGMLVHQAGGAFRLWTGQEPPIEAMREGAERGLAERSLAERGSG